MTDCCIFSFPRIVWFFLLGSLAWRLGISKFVALVALPLAIALAIKSGSEAPWDNLYFMGSAVCLALAMPGLFAATRNVRWMNSLGELSYPLYLVHMSVLYLLFILPNSPIHSWGASVIAFSGLESATNPGRVVTAIVLLVCLLASMLLHQVIERPMRAALRYCFEAVALAAIQIYTEGLQALNQLLHTTIELP